MSSAEPTLFDEEADETTAATTTVLVVDRLEENRLAAVHDLACRSIGLRPHDGLPLWSVAS